MNAAADIVTTLLDSSAKEFMKSYTQDRPLRWEFEPGFNRELVSVKRWGFDGMYRYIGGIRKTGNVWYTHVVAPRNFYKGDQRQPVGVRHEYVSNRGPFRTKEEAAEALWELYEAPR